MAPQPEGREKKDQWVYLIKASSSDYLISTLQKHTVGENWNGKKKKKR